MCSAKVLSGFCEALDWRPLEFVDLSPVKICRLCNVVPIRIYLLECSHSLCEMCFHEVIQAGRGCPLDEKRIQEDCVQELKFTPPQIEKQRIHCVNWEEGCGVEGNVEEVKNHYLSECAFHAIICNGCDTKVLRRDIVKHIFEQQCHRENVSSGAEHIHGSLMPTKMNGQYLHVMGRQLSELQRLLNRILEQQDRVTTDVGKVACMLHEQAQVHEQVYGNVINTGKALETSVDSANTKLSLLEQGMRCTSTDFRDMKAGLDVVLQCAQEVKCFVNTPAATCDMKPMAKAIFDTVQKVKSMEESLRPDSPSESNAAYFHVQRFAELRRKGEKGKAERLSDVVTFCGYSARLQVQIQRFDDGLYLGLYLRICQSPRDSLLRWPFWIPYTFMLVHPTDEKRNVEKCVDNTELANDIQRPNPSFCRPTTTMNPSVGWDKFLKVERIESGNFILKDSVCVAVKAVAQSET